jgi:hypothetical protein
MLMRDFGEKYGGNVQLALRGFQKEKLAAAGGDSSFTEIDKNMRKRKWVANHEAELEGSKDADSHRATKSGMRDLVLCLRMHLPVISSNNFSLPEKDYSRFVNRPWDCSTSTFTCSSE